MAQKPIDPDRIVHVRVTGKSQSTWKLLRRKLIKTINGVLDTVVDHDRGSTLREEAKQFTSALLAHARERLARAGLENEKIEVEVAKLFAERENELAEAREKHAKADAQEFQSTLRKLRLTLGATRAILVGDPGDEAIMLGLQIEEFMRIVKECEQV